MNQCFSQQRAIRDFALYFHWFLFGSDTPLEKTSFYLFKSFFFFSFYFYFFFLVYKRKVDLFQIPHSPGIFAFCSIALSTENLFLQMIWCSSPQNTGSNFEGFCGWNVPAVLVEAIKVILNFLPEKLLYHAVVSHIALPLYWWKGSKTVLGGAFLMLSSVQSTCIWFRSQNLPVAFSWHNCCEVILPRCLMLMENTVLEMPGFALKAYFYSWVKAEREDCSLVSWMFLCRLSWKFRKNVEG